MERKITEQILALIGRKPEDVKRWARYFEAALTNQDLELASEYLQILVDVMVPKEVTE